MKAFFLAGEFVKSSLIKSIVNPFDQSIVEEVCMAEPAHMEIAIEKAQQCFSVYRSTSSLQLAASLSFIAHCLEKDKSALAEIICKEAGKPLKYALGEVDRATQTFHIAAEECKRPPSERIPLDWTSPGKGKWGSVTYFSKGIVAGISPFNFPINLVAHKVAPAIATRSPIILKPSSSTPLAALFLAQIIAKSGLPDGAISVLPCSREVGQLLVEDERIGVLSFTGSPDVGWKMKAQAGKKKVVLELGGNAAAIVHSDADLELAIEKTLLGSFAYSGQVCIHTQRVLVHEKVWDTYLNGFLKATENIQIGNPLDQQCDFSVMIDDKNASRAMDWLHEACERGAKVLMGNKRNGNLIYPTVLTHTQKGMKVRDEEVFGPVVCIEKYKSIEEAIEQVNDSRFGLQAALFTDSKKVIQQCYEKLEVGALIVNDATTFRVDHMPYGGVKDSGFGREGVKYAMLDFLEPKLLVE